VITHFLASVIIVFIFCSIVEESDSSQSQHRQLNMFPDGLTVGLT